MIPLAKKATPAAIAVLRQATAIWPKRMKASDGLLPSKAHVAQNPNSDHNSGHAVDLSNDPANGVNCSVIYTELQKDERVEYLIFKGKIWSKAKGEHTYTGPNQHNKHLHISIKKQCANDISSWFPWMPKPSPINKVKANVIKVKVKKKEPTSPKEN
jgi:hypothetical protein